MALNDLPRKVEDKNAFYRAWNALIAWCDRNSLKSSSDIIVNQSSHGTTLTLVKKPTGKTAATAGGWNWKGIYAESSSYAVNDVVEVDFNKTYSVPFTVDSSSAFPAMCPGIFLNVNTVPAAVSGSRNTLNYYYPINPTIPSSSVVTVSGSKANQTFWQPINPLVQMSVCVGGNSTKTYWVGGWTTDTFNFAQLPYTGSH